MTAKIEVNKLEAARRQIDKAIRMLFDRDDPVPIHTLASAGFTILKDLSEKSVRNGFHTQFQSCIRPGKEREFWGKFNTFANFLKHAERDPESISDNIEDEVNDSLLFLTSIYYQDLGNQLTLEMLVMVCWYTAIHPDIINLEQASAPLKDLIDSRLKYIRDLSRTEQLNEGQEMFGLARSLYR